MLKVHRIYSDRVATIFLSGEFDLSSSNLFRDAALEIIDDTGMDILVDLDEVVYIDSAAVATLIEGYKASKKNKVRFGLVNVSNKVGKVLKLTGLDRFFTIYADRDDALRAFGAGRVKREGG